jgi:hypothetical protein
MTDDDDDEYTTVELQVTAVLYTQLTCSGA